MGCKTRIELAYQAPQACVLPLNYLQHIVIAPEFTRYSRNHGLPDLLDYGAEVYIPAILNRQCGGKGGIRTHGTLAGPSVFKTDALDHYATLPFGVPTRTRTWSLLGLSQLRLPISP